MGKIYEWLGEHPRSVVANSQDWDVADFLLNSDAHLDVRRPVIADMTDSPGGAITILNSMVLNLPSIINCGEIVYSDVPLGTLTLHAPWVGRYSVFDGAHFLGFPFLPIPNFNAPILSADAKAFILGMDGAGTANTEMTFSGDGLVPAASMRFTTLPGFTGTAISPLIRPGGTVVHTDAPSQINDLVIQLKVLIPGFTF